MDNVTLSDYLDPLNHALLIGTLALRRRDNDVVRGLIRDLTRQQNGCRLIQRFLVERPLFSGAAVLEALLPELLVHAVDAYGNYVCQKLLGMATEAQRERLIVELTEPAIFRSVYRSLHGSCVVSTMVSCCGSPAERARICESISAELESVVSDPHGAIMLQQCLDTFAPEECGFIVRYVEQNFMAVAKDRYGCCVVKKCIEQANVHDALLDCVLASVEELACDQYGNYVLQHCMEVLSERGQRECAHRVLEGARRLLFHKHGSNVVEKALECADRGPIRTICAEIVQSHGLVKRMLLDQYANYVLQKLIECVDDDAQRLQMHALVEENIEDVKPSVRRRLESRLSWMSAQH